MKPVVAIDVDGVINVLLKDEASLNLPAHKLLLKAEHLPKSPFVRDGGSKDLEVVIHLAPNVAEWIRSLQLKADVVWATTWESAANHYLAPLLGISPLEVGISTETNPPRFGYVKNGDTSAWKASALSENYPQRPLVWIDDENYRFTHTGLHSNGPSLCISTSSFVGITLEDMLKVTEFVDRWTSFNGDAATAKMLQQLHTAQVPASLFTSTEAALSRLIKAGAPAPTEISFLSWPGEEDRVTAIYSYGVGKVEVTVTDHGATVTIGSITRPLSSALYTAVAAIQKQI